MNKAFVSHLGELGGGKGGHSRPVLRERGRGGEPSCDLCMNHRDCLCNGVNPLNRLEQAIMRATGHVREDCDFGMSTFHVILYCLK